MASWTKQRLVAAGLKARSLEASLPVDDATTENVGVRASEVAAVGPSAVRVRIVLATLVLLAIVVSVLLWGLMH